MSLAATDAGTAGASDAGTGGTTLPASAPPTGAGIDSRGGEKDFTQAQLNEFLAAERRTLQDKADRAAAAAKEEADRKVLLEQAKYKELWETEVKAKQALAVEFESLKLQFVKASVAAEVGLPESMVDRIKGSNREEVLADAKALKALLPVGQAPVGGGAAPPSGKGGVVAPVAKPDFKSARELVGSYSL